MRAILELILMCRKIRSGRKGEMSSCMMMMQEDLQNTAFASPQEYAKNMESFMEHQGRMVFTKMTVDIREEIVGHPLSIGCIFRRLHGMYDRSNLMPCAGMLANVSVRWQDVYGCKSHIGECI